MESPYEKYVLTVAAPMPYDALWLSNDADPGCHEGFPTQTTAQLYNPQDDVSQDEGRACDGCQGGEAENWDITCVEMYDETDPDKYTLVGITTSHVGYMTAYKQPNGELRAGVHFENRWSFYTSRHMYQGTSQRA